MKMPSPFQFVVILLLLIIPHQLTSTTYTNMTTVAATNNIWREAGRVLGQLLYNCLLGASSQRSAQEQFLIVLQECLRRRSLSSFDNILKRDVIEFGNGFALIRYRQENDTRNSRFLKRKQIFSKLDEEDIDWERQMMQRIENLLETHILKIQFNSTRDQHVEEGRHRHHRHSMMPLMVFGMMGLGMIMIPMGFQFLAVLGGKALLLAKMALILTSIQGLKKIATSNVNYGLYATQGQEQCKDGPLTNECDTLDNGDDIFVAFDVEDLSYQGHYDRQWPYEVGGNDVTSSNAYNYYNEPDHRQPDLLHPFYPRVDAIRDKY